MTKNHDQRVDGTKRLLDKFCTVLHQIDEQGENYDQQPGYDLLDELLNNDVLTVNATLQLARVLSASLIGFELTEEGADTRDGAIFWLAKCEEGDERAMGAAVDAVFLSGPHA